MNNFIKEAYNEKIKTLSILTLALGILFLKAPPAMAGSLSRTYSGQFVEPWSKVVTNEVATLEYGFNTLFIKEDTCYAYHTGSRHYAKIRNGNGVHVGSAKAAGQWSKIEVTHSGHKSITHVSGSNQSITS